MSRFLPPLSLIVLVLGQVGCDGPNEFEPKTPDAGFDPNSITAADIGIPCVYDRADPNRNPAEDCKTGLACLIVTRGLPSGLELPIWEDHFTVYGTGSDVGMCTPQGTFANPPSCPAGTVLKLLFSDVAICVRTCDNPSDCGRADYTCDARFFDTDESLCVRKCSLDVPDCVRSGIIEQPPQSGQLIPALAFQDLAGDSQCNVDEGICEFVGQRGVAGPGEPCSRTQDCESGSACLQGPLLAATLRTAIDPAAPGFCASPCTPAEDSQSNCSVGFVCQAAGELNLGFAAPGPFAANLENGVVDGRGGFCFHQCELNVESACGPFPGTECGSFDGVAAGDTWNGITQCLPDALRL